MTIYITKNQKTIIGLIGFYFLGLPSANILAIIIIISLFQVGQIAPQTFEIQYAKEAISLASIILLLVYCNCYWIVQQNLINKIFPATKGDED